MSLDQGIVYLRFCDLLRIFYEIRGLLAKIMIKYVYLETALQLYNDSLRYSRLIRACHTIKDKRLHL